MKKIAVLLLAFATVALTAQAQPRQGRAYKGNNGSSKNPGVYVHRFGGADCMIPDLSQDQQDEIKKLRLEMTKETTSIRNQMAEKRARLNTLKAADKADMNAINKTIDEIAALEAQRMKAKASCDIKVRALLNDEQKVAFDSRRHRNFNFNFDRGMGQMRMRSFRLGDMDFKGLEDGLEGLSKLNDMDLGSGFGQYFEFEMED